LDEISPCAAGLTGKRLPGFAGAFSLIEVVLALGVLAFAILSILALLPLGLQNNRDSYEESVGANIIGSMVADWRSLATNGSNGVSPVFGLPRFRQGMSLSNTLGISDGGQVTNLAVARYRVSYRIVQPATNSFAPYYVNFIVSWPAPATNAVSSIESIAAIPVQ